MMKLRNKKTGEIREIKNILIDEMFNVNSLSELNEEWEDYEEPEDYWCIREEGIVDKRPYHIIVECVEQENRDAMREIGNYFETKEEAEKAVEKLKAWKRLKDKGFKFDRWENDKEKYLGDFIIYAHIKKLNTGIVDDLDLLFGGEE